MEEVTIEHVMEKAKEFQSQNKKWHFHMLTPECTFNQGSNKHAFILENITDSQTLVVYSEKRYMEQGQQLVKMLHGDEILKDNNPAQQQEDENIKTILEKAKQFNEQGIHWHHHMFFPYCMFNKYNAKWCIVFEDQKENKIIEFISENEPKDSLRKIEVLYYSQKP